MRAVYKCRLCGETYTNGCHGAVNTAEVRMQYLHAGVVCPLPMTPTKTETHYCGGPHAGSLGLADFQGWEKEKEECLK